MASSEERGEWMRKRRESALAYFESNIVKELDRVQGKLGDTHFLEGAAMEDIFELLFEAGLVEGEGSWSFRPTRLGFQCWEGTEDAGVHLGLRPAPEGEAAEPSDTTTFAGGAIHIHANQIGALNTGAGGAATGMVNVSSCEDAQHALIGLQDELDELSHQVWDMLFRLRKVELAGGGLPGLREAVEELEIEAFVRSLREDKRKKVLELLATALGASAKTLLGKLT